MSFSTGYDKAEAQVCMTLSAMAYVDEGSPPASIKSALNSLIKQPQYATAGNWELVWFGAGPSPTYDNVMYVAKDTTQTARFAVVVRGTDWEKLLNDWQDFDILATHDWPTANPPDPNIYVAKGTWDGLQELLAMTSDVTNMTPPPITSPMPMVNLFMSEALLNAYDTDIDIFVTGHSLGAALADIISLWLTDTISTWVLRKNKVNIKTYTFASPTVGNQDYANYYNNQVNNPQMQVQGFRVYNTKDIVPFAWDNLPGIINNGIPMDFELALEVEGLTAPIVVELNKHNISYVHVGDVGDNTAVPLDNTKDAPTCNNPAKTLSDFYCWAAYEHGHNTYLTLLGAPVVPLEASAQVADVRAAVGARA